MAGRPRRLHSEAFKATVVDTCQHSGVSIVGIAMANGINANLQRRWIHATSGASGTGGKQRTLPLWKSTAKTIRDWLGLNPNLQANSSLLPRRDGVSMTRANVAQRLKLAVRAATRWHPELVKIGRHHTALAFVALRLV